MPLKEKTVRIHARTATWDFHMRFCVAVIHSRVMKKQLSKANFSHF